MTTRMWGGLVLAILVIVLVWVGYGKIKSHFEEFDQLKTYKEQAQQVSAGTEAGITGLQVAQGGVKQVEIVVSDNRAAAERAFQELKNENQAVGAWAAGVIPVELRNAERERRATLNRSDDPAGRGEGTGTATTSGRDG